MKYFPTIGLEIHVQLATKSKMFCRCDNNAEGKAPNTVTCPVCMGFPGTLPVGNKQALAWGVQAALALNCEVNKFQRFDRKNYFYPDLPKGYQISQFFFPVGENGQITIDYQPDTGAERKEFSVRIKRLHLEEDAGKLVHGKDGTLVDFNRCGTPLMEIVTEPDMHDSKDARAFMQELQRIVRTLSVSMADMEKGHLRVDANISLAPEGSSELGTLVELKNMNSFKFVDKALEYEVKRQTEVLEKGDRIIKETRGWDEKTGTTLSQRTKEESTDYRYFPEPDLPPIVITDAEIAQWKNKLPQLPADLRRQAVDKGLPYGRVIELQDAGNLGKVLDLLDTNKSADIYVTANWVNKEFPKAKYLEDFVLTVKQHNLSNNEALQLYDLVKKHKLSPSELVDKIEKIDETAINAAVQAIINAHTDTVAQYKAGEKKVIGFLIGQVMAKLSGKADPTTVKEILERILGETRPTI
ncbi:TPA: Asp-tRNA(Asn)/Glu-tRNA(Gln) amidotransferase GatCAB subunit B [Patescibacteria group bacterium]|nr:Asp-tRNA(Asn)/Glu-tRNA(Gln) amidotransferase GatCAB subunit B [Patescibacteria group bacterium]